MAHDTPASDSGLPSLGRRRILAATIQSAFAAIGATLAALLGGFALRPVAAERKDRWVRAAAITDLQLGIPQPATISVAQVQGWYRTRARRVVYVTWDGQQVQALSATCSHLGCQVAWDPQTSQFHCPCHGGVYDAKGQVVSGPPPNPLARLDTKLEMSGESGSVLVRV